jgi:uncharacterized repeat protein (TIGR01451 family)
MVSLMRLLNSDLRWYRDRLVTLSACALMALSLAFGLLPRSASAHVIPPGGVQVNCQAATVTVTVSDWAGYVEITRTSPLPVKVTDAPVPITGAGSATFTVAEIGGNGSYTAGRKDNPTDPWPVAFTVDCAPISHLHKQERDVTHPDLSKNSGGFTDGPIAAQTGDTLEYQLVYSNTGSANATLVVVTDPIPAHSTFLSCTAGCSHSASTVTWNVGTVAPEDSVTLNFSVVLDAVFPVGTTEVSNAAVATTHEEQGSTPSNTVIANVPAAPMSSIVKAQRDVTTHGDFVATTITANPGDVLEYRLTYSNTGNAPATNVVVTDPIPARSTFLSCTNSCSHSASTVTWNLGTVAPGTVVLTFQVTLDSNFTAGATTEIKNAAVVTTEGEGNVPSNTVVTTVAPAAEQVSAAAVTLPKAGAGPQQQGSSAPGGGGPFGASGIVATLLLALIGSVLFALRRREGEEPKA